MALTGLVAANNLGDVVDIEKTWDNIGNNISATVFVPSPTLDLNFASNKSLVDNVSGQNLVTFSRASTGRFLDGNGLLQTAASGVPRFDHNGATGESLGLLIEEARTNYLPYSQGFTSGWDTNYAQVMTGQTDPTGGTNAILVKQTNGTSTRQHIRSDASTSIAANFTVSVFVKYVNYDYVILTGADQDGPNARMGYLLPKLRFQFSTETIAYEEPGWGGTSTLGYGFQKYANGWYRLWLTRNTAARTNYWGIAVQSNPYVGISDLDFVTGDNSSSVLVFGFQVEQGSFPTSYIPTSGATATRAADTADITGTNFTRWYSQSQGSFFGDWFHVSPPGFTLRTALGVNENVNFTILRDVTNSVANRNIKETVGFTNFGLAGASYSAYLNGSDFLAWVPSFSNEIPYQVTLGRQGVNRLNGAIRRISYHPIRLSNLTLTTLTTAGAVSSFPYSFSIKGRDILALKEVNKTSTRDFIFTKGLLSRAQPRLTTASQYTSSGVALRDAAMPKFAPVTRGNYFFSSGLTLSGTTVQINGTNALSIATSPFSSSTATVPLLFAGLRPQTNWRISEAMASGVVASPESAIPIATGDFLLFMKAGQS
jgi:hypothetical protein